MTISLNDLEQEFGVEVLLEVTSTLGIDLKDSYEPDSDELLAIRAEAQKILTSATSTTSKPSGSGKKADAEVRKSKSKAQAKSLNRQNKSQGAMVKGQREAVQGILKTEQDSATNAANLAGREFAHTFLEVRSQNWTEFAEAYAGVTDILLEVADQEYLEESDEGDDDPLELAGGFSLLSSVRQGYKA